MKTAGKKLCPAEAEADSSSQDLRPDFSLSQNIQLESESQNEKKKKNLTEALFSNHLVLQRILFYLSIQDLKSCRGVNRQLQLEATKTLLRSFVTQQIGLHFSFNSYIATLSTSTRTIRDTVQNVLHLTHTSLLFPSNNMSVCMRSVEDENYVQDLFWTHGEHIKELELCIHHPSGSGEKCPSSLVLLHALPQQLPNLEKLSIVRIPEQWMTMTMTTETPSPKQQLLKLRNLTYSADLQQNILDLLFSMAHNLDTFCFDTTVPENVAAILTLNKMNLVKEFEFIFTPNRMQVYEALVIASPKFEVISGFSYWNWEQWIPVSEHEISQIISKILYSSAPTLKSILRCPPIAFLTRFPPLLPKLEELQLTYPHKFENDDNKSIFPRCVHLADTFPCLKTLWMSPGRNHSEFYGNRPTQIFPHIDPNQPAGSTLPSVTTLHFEVEMDDHRYNDIPPTWLSHFSRLLPNLSKVKFPTFTDFPSVAEHIWRFCGLEELELTIELDPFGFSFPVLDSAFTGFSTGTCHALHQNLLQHQHTLTTPSSIQQLRNSPSIVDLTRLKRLRINFEEGGGWSDEQYWLVLSHVTGQYAFGMMNPDLEVTLVAKHLRIQDGVGEILPFVKSYPEVLLP